MLADGPKLSDVESITDASHRLKWSWWRVSKALDNHVLEVVRLPNGQRAVVKSSVDRLLSKLEGN